MSRVISFSVDKISKKALAWLWSEMNSATNELYMEVFQNSPVDTGYYQSNHRNKWVRIEGVKLIWAVENESDYPETLEEGWRKTPVNWHLQKWEIYVSVGADTYKKSVQKVGERLFDRLKKRW